MERYRRSPEMINRINGIGKRIDKEINMKNKEKQRAELKLDVDQKNREYVKEQVEQYMLEGKSKEEAVDKFMSEQKNFLEENFDYLIKNGLDIRICIFNWTNRRKNRVPQKNKNAGEER